MNSAPAIAITGLALRLPGAESQDDFWKLLAEGTDRTAPVSQHRRDLASDQNWSDTVGELDDIQRFDAEFFGIAPATAAYMDPQERILLECVWQCVADAGYVPPSHAATGQRVSWNLIAPWIVVMRSTWRSPRMPTTRWCVNTWLVTAKTASIHARS